MELAASSAYDTGWLSSFSYTLLLIGSGLSNRRTSYIGVSFSCLWLLPIVFTSNVRLPQGPCHTKEFPLTPAAAAVAAGPYLGCYGSHAEDIGMGLWQLFWLMLVAGSHSCSV